MKSPAAIRTSLEELADIARIRSIQLDGLTVQLAYLCGKQDWEAAGRVLALVENTSKILAGYIAHMTRIPQINGKKR